MRWPTLVLTLALLTPALAGCLQADETTPQIREAVAERAQLAVGLTGATYQINRTVAQDTGLAREAAAAVAGIENVHRRAFADGQKEDILARSEHVHIAFHEPTTLLLPKYRGGTERTFTDLHLILNTTALLDGNVLAWGPDTGGAWTTTYRLDPLAEAATAAVAAVRDEPAREDDNEQEQEPTEPMAGPVPFAEGWGPLGGWVTGIQDRTTVVVRNHTQLVGFYANLTAGIRPPQVLLGHHADDEDRFEDHLYLGAFMGPTSGGCDRVSIDAVTYDPGYQAEGNQVTIKGPPNGTLVVKGRWIQVNASACQAPVHWPFQVVRAQTGERGIPTNAAVEFRMENVTLDQPAQALVPFDELDPGAWGAEIGQQARVITDQSAYNETWYRYLENYGPRTPAVSQPLWASFEHDTVVGIAWGPVDDWCADIGTHDVLYNGTTDTIEVQGAIYDTPGGDCVDKEEPFHPVTFVRIPAVAGPVDVTFHDLHLTELPMQPIAKGSWSQIEDRGVHVISDQRAWQQLWTDHARPGEERTPPAVDFDRHTVIAAFFGDRPNGCYDVELHNFTVLGASLAGVYGAYVKTGQACIDSETQPFQIVKAPWHHGQIKAAMRDET